MSIKLLPDHVINQIAAGEVIDRPASVVKELVDNAIDSGSKTVKVVIQQGGAKSILVIDKGVGMTKDDALLSFERHATSKISSLEDLQEIATNGFRGEALSSIASVAQVIIKTKNSLSELGTTLEIRGGKLISVKSEPLAKGTSIEVKNLFFNVPARKKFLKSSKTEEDKIYQLLLNYALAYPELEFELVSDDKQLFLFESSDSKLLRAKKIIKGSTTEVNYSYDHITVEGLVGHPGNATALGSNLTIIVNKRFVNDRFILRAIKEGFLSTLKDREFPVGAVSVTLPGSQVDVNVHPQKSEVRFVNSQKVFTAVKTAIEESVKSFRGDKIISTFNLPSHSKVNSYSTQPSLWDKDEDKVWGFKFIGQIFSCYILFTHEDKMIMMDMHATHERIQYNKILKIYDNSEQYAQKLLIPIEISLSSQELLKLTQIEPKLQALGFNWFLDDKKMLVDTVPSILQHTAIDKLLKEILNQESILNLDSTGSVFAIEEAIAYICARQACHASVRAGDLISKEESYALLKQILSTDFGSACPHGRPCMIEFEKNQIEGWFGRDK